MSSGEKAKPPATFEERNPFDISRRSGPEVAAEIAKRMSAWKQARARTVATPTTIPSDEAKSRMGDVVKAPPIAAPVQPARMPKSTPPAPQPAPSATARSTGSATLRVPYFASASATRRAMPPAPSLKQDGTRPLKPADDEPAVRADEPIEIVASVPDQASPHHDEPAAEPPLVDTAPVAATAVEEVPLESEAASDVPQAELPDQVDSPPVADTSESVVEEPDQDRRRAEARAIKARWIAAHDLDALLDTAATDGASTVGATAAVAHETGSGESPETSAHGQVAENGPPPDEQPDRVASGGELLLDEPVEPEPAAPFEVAADQPATTPELAAETLAATAMSDDAAERLESAFDAPAVHMTPAPATGRGEASALNRAALDEMAGRREPSFDAPVAQEMPDAPDEAREPGIAAQDNEESGARVSPAADLAKVAADDGLSIAALDEVAGRREPTFDEPVALEIERPVRQGAPATESRAAEPSGASEIELEERRTLENKLSIAALDEAAGRREPTFDEPVRPAKPAAVQTAAPRVKLRPIETRIEVRRIDPLRADPQLSARRPIFPHIEPEDWQDMAPVAAQTRRERRGTGWAIGLGTVLLVAGITAPAAIWQQGRQAQDQVALMNPAVTPQQAPAATATATPQVPVQAPVQATLPESPQPESQPSVPAVTAQESSVPSAPAPDTPKSETDQAAANPKPATTLSTVNDSGDVDESPVVAPPPPMVNLASKTATPAPTAARPFVPEQGDGPFLRAPTTGATSVPVAGAPVQSAAVGVKPNLMVQLKPGATATVSGAKPVAARPRQTARTPKPFFQQSPDQMFQTLIDTLGEGKPVNPATKPVAPSNRR